MPHSCRQSTRNARQKTRVTRPGPRYGNGLRTEPLVPSTDGQGTPSTDGIPSSVCEWRGRRAIGVRPSATVSTPGPFSISADTSFMSIGFNPAWATSDATILRCCAEIRHLSSPAIRKASSSVSPSTVAVAPRSLGTRRIIVAVLERIFAQTWSPLLPASGIR